VVGVEERASAKEATMRGFIIGAFVVVVGLMGNMYLDSEENTVLKAPGFEIKKY
jgi:uncharacterized oligopeptide transporter (OPT) family protein